MGLERNFEVEGDFVWRWVGGKGGNNLFNRESTDVFGTLKEKSRWDGRKSSCNGCVLGI